MSRIARICAFLIILMPFAVSLFAADVNLPSPGQEAGAQAERFQSESSEIKKELEKKAPPPKVEIEEEKEEKPPAAEAVSFILKEVTVADATIFKPEEFRPIYEPYLNKKVTFADLEAIIEKIKNKYREKGYFTATAYLPEQETGEGKILIRVAEGKMGGLLIEGNKRVKASWIESCFHTKKNEILNFNVLQRDILWLNKTPDLEVKTIISAGKEVETSDITLKVKEGFPWHVGFMQDNQGTRLSGKNRSSFYARGTNVTGHNDSFFMNTLYATNSLGGFISYKLPIDTRGTNLGLDLAYFKVKAGKEYKSLDIPGVSKICAPHISKELVLTETFEAYGDLGLEIKSIKRKIGGEPLSDDQLRLPYASLSFVNTDSFCASGQTTFSPKFVFGTDGFLGASSRRHPSAAREGTGGFFFKYEHAVKRIQKMPWDSYISASSQFQIASHTLPSSEQIQLGGANSIRGYPEGDYLADLGGNLSVDWVFPMYFIPRDWKLPHSDKPLWRQIEPVIFTDLGGGRLRTALTGEKRDKFMIGAGGGIRLHLYDKIYVKLDWANRLGDRPTQGVGASTFHFTFQSEL